MLAGVAPKHNSQSFPVSYVACGLFQLRKDTLERPMAKHRRLNPLVHANVASSIEVRVARET